MQQATGATQVGEATPTSVEELAERYLAAWNAHDLEAILALHTPTSEFHINGNGLVQEWKGIDACREAFAFILEAWPDQTFEPKSLIVRENLYIGVSKLTGTLSQPWPAGETMFEPVDTPISFDLLDIVQCEGNRVAVKSSWIDAIAVRDQLARLHS